MKPCVLCHIYALCSFCTYQVTPVHSNNWVIGAKCRNESNIIQREREREGVKGSEREAGRCYSVGLNVKHPV